MRPVTKEAQHAIDHALVAIAALFEPGDVIEIRALGVGRTADRSGSTYAGYFKVEKKQR